MTSPDDLCVCGHARREHLVGDGDVGCTHVIVPVSGAISPFECHCSRYRHAASELGREGRPKP
jgi:hypothetical protein